MKNRLAGNVGASGFDIHLQQKITGISLHLQSIKNKILLRYLNDLARSTKSLALSTRGYQK